MNAYRLVADLCHVLAILVLLLKFWKTRSSDGISGKTQFLYAITYTSRYLDVFVDFISVYNTSMKIFYILVSYYVVFATYSLFISTHQQEYDTFRIELLILPVTALTFFINHANIAEDPILELWWTWSMYMEAVALIPQLFMIWKMGRVDGFVSNYIILMAAYRGMYIANWVYRYYFEGYYDLIAVTSGVVETAVGIFGVLSVFSIKLGEIGMQSLPPRGPPSIYLLPSVYEQLGNDFLIYDEKKGKPKEVPKYESSDPTTV